MTLGIPRRALTGCNSVVIAYLSDDRANSPDLLMYEAGKSELLHRSSIMP
jgi:hypothetical protein